MVPVDRVSYNEVDRATGRIVLAHSMHEPPAPNLVSSLNTHIRDHPGFSQPDAASDWPAPTKISDYLSQRQFLSLGLYHDHFRLYGIHYQHGVAFATGAARRITFGLNRAHRDFSEETRTLLTLLRPHLARAYERARSRAELEAALLLRDHALDAVALLLLTPDGGIACCSPPARTLLGRYFGSLAGDAGAAPHLPVPLAQWVARQANLFEADILSSEMLVRRGARRLLVRLELRGTHCLLGLTDRPAQPSAERLRALGLTDRETDVLFWLAQRGDRAYLQPPPADGFHARPQSLR